MYFYDNSGMEGYFKALPRLHAFTNSMQTWLKMVPVWYMQYNIKLNSLNHCTYWLNTFRSKACQHVTKLYCLFTIIIDIYEYATLIDLHKNGLC